MIDQDLVAFIKTLNTPAENRVHLGNAPQGSLKPVIVIRRTGGSQPQTTNGTRLFARAQFTINVIADEYVGAYPTADQIRTAVRSFKGRMGTTEVVSTRVLADPADASEIDGDKVTRWLTQDVLIVHR